MRLLLLAGTPEAVRIGYALGREQRLSAMASMARAGRTPAAMNLPMRIGGWGGDDAFAAWLKREGIDAVLDATHPYASRISHRAAEVTAALGLSYVQFLRPAWTPGPEDTWIFLNAEEEAADHSAPGDKVLLSTGLRGIERFAALDDRHVWVRVREINGTAFPFRNGRFLHRPVPLPVANEAAGLRALGADILIARNSGGGASTPLIEAASRLKLPVGMIRRPPQPEAARISTVSEALAWVRRRL